MKINRLPLWLRIQGGPIVLALLTLACLLPAGCQTNKGSLPRGGTSVRQIAQTRLPAFLGRSLESRTTAVEESDVDSSGDAATEPSFLNGNEADSGVLSGIATAAKDILPLDTADDDVLNRDTQDSEAGGDSGAKLVAQPAPPATADEACARLLVLRARIERDYDDNVRKVDLAFRNFSDTDANMLSLLPDVTELDVTGTGLTDAALKPISEMSALQSLKLKGTSITDSGLQQIGKLKQLRILDVGQTQVTDEALRELTELKHLRYLVLNHTALTDRCIEFLKLLPGLRGVNLIGSSVTAEGILTLRKELPDCLVVFEVGTEFSFIHLPAEFSLAARQDRSGDHFSDMKLQQLLQVTHRNPALGQDLAEICAKKDQWSDSAAILQVAAAALPHDEQLQYRLAVALAYAGQTEEAFGLFRRFLDESTANYAVGAIVHDRAAKMSEMYVDRALSAAPHNTKAQELREQIRGGVSARRTDDGGMRNPVSPVSLPVIVPRQPRAAAAQAYAPAVPFDSRGLPAAWPRL